MLTSLVYFLNSFEIADTSSELDDIADSSSELDEDDDYEDLFPSASSK